MSSDYQVNFTTTTLLIHRKRVAKMKVSAIASLCALDFAGICSAHHGFLTSCSEFELWNPGKSYQVWAKCLDGHGEKQINLLDLGLCFGWSGDTCGFTFPPAG